MEKLDGTREEIDQIRQVLDIYRSNPQRCIDTGDDRKIVCSLKDSAFQEKVQADPALFTSLVMSSIHLLKRDRGWRVEPIAPDRYYFLDLEPGDQGGIYSRRPGGYRHLYDAGYTPCLNPGLGLTPRQASLEYARCYLHDSLHRSTFRSYRKDRRCVGEVKIYREKYGFNLRNADGVSYSSPTKPPEGGFINLNLLMDGIVTLLVSEALRESVKLSQSYEEFAVHPLTKECLANDYIAGSNSQKFHSEVVGPTRQFLEYWYRVGSVPPSRLVGRAVYAMKRGSHRAFKEAFGSIIERTGSSFAKLFRQKSFDRGIGRR